MLLLGAGAYWYYGRAGDTPAVIAKSGDAPAATKGKSIAVLPFVNMSTDAEQEYFSDGISEQLINSLAKIPELRVISRSSTFSLKGQAIGAAEIAKRLGITEGTVKVHLHSIYEKLNVDGRLALSVYAREHSLV